MELYEIIFIIVLLFSFTYTTLIFLVLIYWNKINQHFSFVEKPKEKVSILIPARDESQNIINCLQSILNQDYPRELIELIVIDDHSEDQTNSLVKDLILSNSTINIKLLEVKDYLISKGISSSNKKIALEYGIQESTSNYILTTDADCIVPEKWVNYMLYYFTENNAKFVTAPVQFTNTNSLFEQFQVIDFMGMMLLTGAGIQSEKVFFANGANLGFEKSAFYEVNGYEGNEHIASGDDLFLLEKIQAKYPNDIYFVKSPEAIVKTRAPTSINSFIQQRIRWGGKSAALNNLWLKTIALFMVLFVWTILITGVLSVFNHEYLLVFLACFFTKFCVDFIFLLKASSFFKQKKILFSFITSQILHTFYIAFIGILSNIKNTTWKGRKI